MLHKTFPKILLFAVLLAGCNDGGLCGVDRTASGVNSEGTRATPLSQRARGGPSNNDGRRANQAHDETIVRVVARPPDWTGRVNLAEFVKTETPQVFIEFSEPSNGNPQGSSAALPESGSQIVEQYWRFLLAYKYNNEVIKPENGVVYKNNLTLFFVEASRTVEGLQEVTLTTPNGTRSISFNEASEILHQLREAADELVVRAAPNIG